MTRPKATLVEVRKMVVAAGIVIPEAVYLVAIRGYYKDTMGKPGENDRGIYDDAIFLITPSTFTSFNANTDPSKFTPGIAKLIPGLHYFKRGKHGISKPGGGYPAFRPASPDESLPVTREGKEGTFKGIAINIHKGGATYTSSAGCQTLFPDQWPEFIRSTYEAMDKENQKVMPYLLLEA